MATTRFSSSHTHFGYHYSQADLERVLHAARGHVVVHTSGSTGEPKAVVIARSALEASAQATHEALAGPGQWLLALPTHHIAGIAVLSRSVLAGTTPVAITPGTSFTSESFLRASDTLSDSVRYASLVPTQLHRLMADAESQGASGQHIIDALASYSAILVGGAATNTRLLEQARSAGANIVTTYGMSETSGGCVYNNQPLNNVQIRLDETSRIHIASPVLASGYLAHLDEHQDPQCQIEHELIDNGAFEIDSAKVRWHRTNDLGAIDPASGQLTVLGRADDIIVSGGLNIAPALIENLLGGEYGIGQLCVVGVPDPEWGHKVVALYTGAHVHVGQALPIEQIKAQVKSRLGVGYMPRTFIRCEELPHTQSGKVDRIEAQRIAQAFEGATD